jgi:hypothetical protein
MAISGRGLSRPFFIKSGLAVNQHVYKEHCLQRTLLPFIRRYNGDGQYYFLPEKASAHYA